MFCFARILRRLVLPVSLALAFSVFALCSLRAEEEKTDTGTGTLTLTVQLAPTAPASEDLAAKENEKDPKDSDTAKLKEFQKAVADVQKKMAEAQAEMESAKSKWRPPKRRWKQPKRRWTRRNRSFWQLAASRLVRQLQADWPSEPCRG